MRKASIRRLARPQPRPHERFLDVLRRRLSQRRPPSVARRRVPLLMLRTCDVHVYFGLLERGPLHAARFNDDGAGEWLALTVGQGPLTSANGLASQADILINTRRAANRLGAMRMEALDRIAANAINGKLYCAMTHNSPRTHERVAHVMRREPDHYDQIIECTEDHADGTGEPFTWALFLRCGGPSNGADSAHFAGLNPQPVSPVSFPYHIAFELCDNLWIATAGQASVFRTNGGLDAIAVAGSQYGYWRQCLSCVPGGTIAGLTFTPNNHPLFCSVQQPPDGSSLNDPSSTWPERAIPPRPSGIAVEKTDGCRVSES
jgi:secreted PhoX family phosphatase